MESLVANYASSDEEEGISSKPNSFFSSLPHPESPSLFQSLPKPNHSEEPLTDDNTSLLSSLPKPKSLIHETIPPPRVSSTKKVVQFTPPVIPLNKPVQLDDDDDSEDEGEKRKRLKSKPETASVKSFLSTILPAPRNSSTLGVQSTSAQGRRSTIETHANVDASVALNEDQNDSYHENNSNHQYMDSNINSNSYGYGGEAATSESYYVNNEGYVGCDGYGQCGNDDNWGEGYGVGGSEVSESGVKVGGKRRRSEIPKEIIEVKQDELMKNRPREDQSKMTGIAFGPSYQPVSAKGKPSKLHRRKHQIGSLFFDMKQRESELSERRAKGMLTKAETQAKYGW